DSFVLQVPLALDEPGQRGRARRNVPRCNFENARTFVAQGLKRFVLEPLEFITLSGNIPGALFAALPRHLPIAFGAGSVRLRTRDGSLVPLGPRGSADVLAEMIAALVYHYDPDRDGGTALTDVFINDGDFAVMRLGNGALDVRLTAARHRESGIGRNLFISYLLQMMAYEDFTIDGSLTGVPLLVSNPAVTFEGLVRGLRHRFSDLDRSPEAGVVEARRWIAEFAGSREGRAYRRFAEAFLEGRLELTFGEDLREHWWRRFPLERKQNLLELRSRVDPLSGAADSARLLKTFIERLGREVGRLPEDPTAIYFNDLDGEGLRGLLDEARIDEAGRERIVPQVFEHWPWRALDSLLGRVPEARGLRRFKSRLTFGDAISPNDEGTLRSLGAPPKLGPSRPVANRELFDAHFAPAGLAAAALSTFPTFETYMDAALHDADFGYYARRVVIGQGGHFDTHPEELSPHYGEWIASLAFKAWRDLVQHGELTAEEPFSLVEFGAGNGRLARDVLDFVSRASTSPAVLQVESWKAFASCLRYRIYEMSASLRERQASLLGERATICEGDARSPNAALSRDFPLGLKGLVVTNEVPDAFGVHKVVLTAEGDGYAALVVPRVEESLVAALGREISERASSSDATIRERFGFSSSDSELYLDDEGLHALLRTVANLESHERDERLGSLWFEELYVPVSALPALANHFATNADDYANALAAEPSGVVVYVNLHAERFVQELGATLGAGFVLTIDYGETTWGLVQNARRGDFPFRVYGDQLPFVPRPNDPYTTPGSQDLTADVNFSALANAGRRAGLEVIHFGPERDIVGDDVLPDVLRAAARDPFAKFLGHPGFKTLLLGKRASAAFDSRFATALALSAREQDVPKARRDQRASIHRRLSGLGAR
ncbi:MAG TPA: SAM-dependent methyltransferase, partial [Polyangiaceae bacterium]|nr:SAM-dependent methyltransferase [Polyangiaceae bacterium]